MMTTEEKVRVETNEDGFTPEEMVQRRKIARLLRNALAGVKDGLDLPDVLRLITKAADAAGAEPTLDFMHEMATECECMAERHAFHIATDLVFAAVFQEEPDHAQRYSHAVHELRDIAEHLLNEYHASSGHCHEGAKTPATTQAN